MAYTGIGRALWLEEDGTLSVPTGQYPIGTLFSTKRRAHAAMKATIALDVAWVAQKTSEFVVVKMQPTA